MEMMQSSSRGKRMKIQSLNGNDAIRKLRLLASLLGVVALVLCTSLSARAQVTTAAIRGTVSDEQGGAVAGAEVTATNVATNYSRTVTTASDGAYNFSDLPLGSY